MAIISSQVFFTFYILWKLYNICPPALISSIVMDTVSLWRLVYSNYASVCLGFVYPYIDGFFVVHTVSEVDLDMQDGNLVCVCTCSELVTGMFTYTHIIVRSMDSNLVKGNGMWNISSVIQNTEHRIGRQKGKVITVNTMKAFGWRRCANNKDTRIATWGTPCFNAPVREKMFSCIARFYFNFLFAVSQTKPEPTCMYPSDVTEM
jgi:hypothetical protein